MPERNEPCRPEAGRSLSLKLPGSPNDSIAHALLLRRRCFSKNNDV
jgi:hypothetical protein